MLAITCLEAGGPEVLSIAEVPSPAPDGAEVLIDVAAAGVNRADLLQRQGFYPAPQGASQILGLECSGVVAAIGADVTGVQVGDQVCALLAGGGYAQQVAVPAGQVMPIPSGIDLVTAAGLPEVAATVFSNLQLTAQLRPGETLLVHGGASGIGTFAIQWAKALGCTVLVTVGSAHKMEFCLGLGADAAINYREQDFAQQVEELTNGRGVDVILDIIGAKYLDANLRSLAVDGRLVVIGLQGGVRAEIDLSRLLSRRGSVFGTSLRSRPASEKAMICRQLVAEVWPLIADGTIRPVVDQVLPWTDVAQAHRVLAASDHVGKVLLRV